MEKTEKELLERTIILATCLIDTFDELEKHGFPRAKLKIAAKPFKIQLEQYVTRVFKHDSQPLQDIDMINEKIAQLEKII